VEALAALVPKAEAADSISSALGLSWRSAPSAPTDAPPVPAPPSEPLSVAPLPSASEVPLPAPLELQPLRPQSTRLELPPANSQGAPSNPLASAGPRSAPVKPPYQPLFQDRWWRALARTMLATQTQTGVIDLRIVAKYLRTGRPIERLPWLSKATLRRGVVLILDHSESMQPFWRDESELVERCRRVIGSPGVRSYLVETDPWSEDEPRLRWLQPEPCRLPAETPVVIVSDFELGRQIMPRLPLLAPWLPLIEKSKSSGATTLALIPIPRAFWPVAVTRAIPNAIAWDHDTTTTAVRRSICHHG
jgi:hypothetical protein